jgi:two-component system LytT family response regulator
MKESLIKAMIVEDMTEYIGTIELLIKEVAPSVIIVGKSSTLTEAEKIIKEELPDVVFLDIQFESEGKTCFDLLEKFKNDKRFSFQFIIITAHMEKQYYARAFEYKALHFLEKPINKLKLAESIERVRETLVEHKLSSLATLLHTEIGSLKTETKSQKINIEGVLFNEIVDVNDIVWIEAAGRKSNVYLQNDRKIISSSNLGFFEIKLEPFLRFLRINRSEIINTEFVSRYSRKEKLAVLKGVTNKFFISKEVFPTFLNKVNL